MGITEQFRSVGHQLNLQLHAVQQLGRAHHVQHLSACRRVHASKYAQALAIWPGIYGVHTLAMCGFFSTTSPVLTRGCCGYHHIKHAGCMTFT